MRDMTVCTHDVCSVKLNFSTQTPVEQACKISCPEKCIDFLFSFSPLFTAFPVPFTCLEGDLKQGGFKAVSEGKHLVRYRSSTEEGCQ